MDIFTIYGIVFFVIVLDAGFHLSHAMLDGVMLGIFISVFAFVYQSTQITVIRNSIDGRLFRSKVVRTYWEEALLTRVGQRVSILQFDGFIFFASATSIFDRVKAILGESSKRCSPERIRYFLFDFEHVQSVDESGIKMLKDVQRYVQNYDSEGIEICYTGLRNRLKGRQVYTIYLSGISFCQTRLEKVTIGLRTQSIKKFLLLQIWTTGWN